MQTYSITIGVGEDSSGAEIEPAERDYARARFAAFLLNQPRIGGYTVQVGSGGWENDDGRVVEEPCLVFTVGVEDPKSDVAGIMLDGSVVYFMHELERMRWIAQVAAVLFTQECTCLECRRTGEFFVVAGESEE